MNNTILIYSIVLLTGVFMSSISQVMLKKASLKQYNSVLQEYINPLVVSAYALFFITTLLSVFAYKGIPLSLGPVLEATSYLYITFFGVTIFKEKINKQKIFSLFLIVLGILVYSFL